LGEIFGFIPQKPIRYRNYIYSFLSFLNRYFEILKWQNLAHVVKPISIYEATKQVLVALTLGVFTPVGVGEYAGKALYFNKKTQKNSFP